MTLVAFDPTCRRRNQLLVLPSVVFTDWRLDNCCTVVLVGVHYVDVAFAARFGSSAARPRQVARPGNSDRPLTPGGRFWGINRQAQPLALDVEDGIEDARASPLCADDRLPWK